MWCRKCSGANEQTVVVLVLRCEWMRAVGVIPCARAGLGSLMIIVYAYVSKLCQHYGANIV